MDTSSALGNGSEGQVRWSLRLFGGFELRALPGAEEVVPPGKRERVLLAYLALSPKGRRERRKLVPLLWGDDTDAATLDNLRTCVWNLRKALGDTEHRLILSDGRDIVLDSEAFGVDVLAFRRLVAQSGTAEMEGAASLYAGDFLDGLSIESEEFESWRREEATLLKDQALNVLTRLMTQSAEMRATEDAIKAGLRILRIEPLHEAAVRCLMRLYAESGRRGAAVELYRTLAEALRKELSAQPKAETRAVFADVSRGADEPLSPATSASAAPAPVPHAVGVAKQGDTPREQPSTSEPAPSLSSPSLSWPAKAGHPGDAGLIRRPAVFRSRWILAFGLAAAATAALLFYQFAPPPDTTGAQQPTGIETAKALASSPASAVAIAVLPFVNLSGDPSQDFFSDGMTEEITSALARVPGLTVLARTSAFEYKGQNRDVRAIGGALGARYLIEGSVRKDGQRVRISAQLVEATNGAHVWAESYDRELVDLLSTQEDIARAIAASLRVPLGLGPNDALVSYRPADNETYELFLRGRAAFRARNAQAVTFLEQVVARDPNFAPGWALLARALNSATILRIVRGEVSSDAAEVFEARARMDAYANMSIALAPGYAGGYAFLANLNASEGKWQDAMDYFSEALARDPYDPETLNGYRNMLRSLGYLKEALEISERLHLVEPLVPIYQRLRAEVLAANGMTEKAVTEYLRAGGGSRPGDMQFLTPAYAELGRFTDAVEAMSEGGNRPRFTSGPFAEPLVEAAMEVLRAAASKSEPPSPLPDLDGLSIVYLYTRTPERMLDPIEDEVKNGSSGFGTVRSIWWPMPSSLRKTERFKTLVRDAGLVDYWRARGWPDLCRPVGADDFVCD